MWYKVASLVLFVYILLYLVLPRTPYSSIIYFLSIICWFSVSVVVILLSMKDKTNIFYWRLSNSLILYSFIVGITQITLLMLAGVFTEFGRSPYSFTLNALLLNIAYFLSKLIGMELSRVYLIKSIPRSRIITGTVLVAIFYTLVAQPITLFLSLNTLPEIAKFIGLNLIPSLAQNLFASYLALLGGFSASITYNGVLTAFEWLSPILPNPPWALKSLIMTLIPTVGFFNAENIVSPVRLLHVGLIGRKEIISRRIKKKKLNTTFYLFLTVILTMLIWGSTDLLGFRLSIVASGSMKPSLNVGDIIVTIKVDPECIKIGDIIQYYPQNESAPIVHRVIEINRIGGRTYIITKGDANSSPDDPIVATEKINKVVFVIPKLGWIGIYTKILLKTIWAFLSNNLKLLFTIVVIALAALIYRIYSRRTR